MTVIRYQLRPYQNTRERSRVLTEKILDHRKQLLVEENLYAYAERQLRAIDSG